MPTPVFRYLPIVGFVISAAGTSVFARDTELEFPLTAERIVFLGDSITNAGHYIADIETQLRAQGFTNIPEMINLGLGSETCSGLSEPDHPFPRPDVHERLDRVLEKTKPDVVVACYGMNDGIYHPFDDGRFAAYQGGIKKIAEKSRAAGAKLILLTPPPFDAQPLKGKPGKLLPAGAEKYAWFAVYEDYGQVIERYAKWIMTQTDLAEMVIDVHTPLNAYLAEQRRSDPDFKVAHDGVHMDTTGHEIMARAILQAWGITPRQDVSKKLHTTVEKKTKLLHDAWLSHVGHKRPSVKPGLPLEEARQKAAQLQEMIDSLAGSPDEE